MAIDLVFLIRLRPGASPDEFETFLRDVELPMVRSWPSTVGQRTLRVDGFFEDAGTSLPADYVDVIRVSDQAAYEADLTAARQTPEFDRFAEGWTRLVEGDIALRTTPVAGWEGPESEEEI